jgi:4-carboxymuconolactone decarboxylase
MASEDNLKKFEQIFGEGGKQVFAQLEKYSPRFANYVYDYVAGNLFQDKSLDVRTRMLCVIACYTALGGVHQEQLKIHIKTALRAGASSREVLAVLETVGAFAGVSRAVHALLVAIPILEAEEASQ